MSGPPVKLATVPRDEAVSLNSLIQTDNKLFNKVILIFAYLCDQVEILKQQAQAHFYGPLLLLAEGEDLGGEGEAPKARSRLPAPSAQSRPLTRRAARSLQATQRPEATAAALLPLLFAMQQFVARANSLAINLLHQLASLCARLSRPTRKNPSGCVTCGKTQGETRGLAANAAPRAGPGEDALADPLPRRYVAKQRQFSATFKNVHLRNVFASLAGAAARSPPQPPQPAQPGTAAL